MMHRGARGRAVTRVDHGTMPEGSRVNGMQPISNKQQLLEGSNAWPVLKARPLDGIVCHLHTTNTTASPMGIRHITGG